MATIAASTAPETEAGAEDAAAPKKSKKKLFLILALILALAGAGAGAWFFYFQPKAEDHGDQEVQKVVPTGPPVFVVLDPFTVNLQPEGQFLQAAFTLQVGKQEDANQIKNYLPQVRSRMLMLLSSYHAEDLVSPEGKNKLLENITKTVEAPFAEGLDSVKLLNVFITSFVIQ